MSTYRKEWSCCDSVTETQSWEPAECPFCQSKNNEQSKDAERIDGLARFVSGSSYGVYLQVVRHPSVNAGMNRFVANIGVGSGVWQKSYEGSTLRSTIDAALANSHGEC